MTVVSFYTGAAFLSAWFLFGSFRTGVTCAAITASSLLLAARHLTARRRKLLRALIPDNPEERPPAAAVLPAGSDANGAAAGEDGYDVIIMGGGVVGLMQALVLSRKLPSWAKVLVVEPQEDFTDHKWGESMVEVSTTLLTKHLGLQDYLIQNHSPKHGLFYHWPGDSTVSADSMSDYYSIWGLSEPSTVSYQVDRRVVERDFSEIAKSRGVRFLNGKVKKAEVPDGCGYGAKTVTVRMDDGSSKTVSARHLVDATGRARILGRLKKNILSGRQHTFGAHQGSVFMRVVGVDKNAIFDDGYHPYGGAGSRYYGTNHFFGEAHWCWMIPINPRGFDLSIGVVYHPDKIDPQSLNTQEKMIEFLREHHNVLAKLIESSDEIRDFKHLAAPLGYCSDTYLSHDGWSVIGEAAVNWDPFYSTGLAMAAFQTTAVAESIRQELSGAVHPGVLAERVAWWNETVKGECYGNGTIVLKQMNHLGHCSAMSWRVFFENVLYFGITFPSFAGEYNLHFDTKNPLALCNHNDGKPIGKAQEYVFQLLDEIVEPGSGINAGMMHTYTPGELTLFGWDLGMRPLDGTKTTQWLEGAQFEPLRLNAGRIQAWAMVQLMAICVVLGFRVRGPGFVLRKDFWSTFFVLAQAALHLFVIAFVHDLSTYGVAPNAEWAAAKAHQRRNYVPPPPATR